MNLSNVELAKETVAEFLRLLDLNLTIYGLGPLQGQSTAARRERAQADSTHRQLLHLHSLVEDIAEAVDPDEPKDRFKPTSPYWVWEGSQTSTMRLAGILDQQETREALFEPTGPRLQADRLHRWVWDAAKNLWDDGHYGPAVHDSTKAVERHTQIKLNRLDLDGKDLYAQAFSTKDPEVGAPRLRFTEIDKTKQLKRWTSAHEGAQYLGMGCAQGIRNPQAHGTDDLDEQEALEELAALSVLARWVELSELVEHKAS